MKIGFFEKKIVLIVFLIPIFYFSLFPISWVISSIYIDDIFFLKARGVMKNNGCLSEYPNKKIDNFLLPLDFYYDMNYWFSDYRIYKKDFDIPGCFYILKNQMELSAGGLKVIVVDSDLNIIFEIIKK